MLEKYFQSIVFLFEKRKELDWAVRILLLKILKSTASYINIFNKVASRKLKYIKFAFIKNVAEFWRIRKNAVK